MANLFVVKKEERAVAAAILLIIIGLQTLMVSKFCVLLSDPSHEAWMRFMRNYHMSGFDPISYTVLRHWTMGYDVLRHPLLAFMMWPLSMLNMLLRSLTGADCAVPVMALLLTLPTPTRPRARPCVLLCLAATSAWASGPRALLSVPTTWGCRR